MIRSTKNGTILSNLKDRTGTPIQSASIEHVLAGADEANAVVAEKRDIDARATYQTTTPSNGHNGVYKR